MVSFVNPDLFGSFGLPHTYPGGELMPARSPAVSPWVG
jgi:hypothetical protein